jgi:hypothetical protein
MIKKILIDNMFKLFEEQKNRDIVMVKVSDRFIWMYENDYKRYIRKLKLEELNIFDE